MSPAELTSLAAAMWVLFGALAGMAMALGINS